VSVIDRLTAAGCVAADEEAAELEAAARDTTELEELVARRVNGEPLAWLVGSVMFCDVRVNVHPGVYVPRWQTEPMARRAAALLPDHGIAVDLCTGSGAIACVLRDRVPDAVVVATDVDPLAVACAQDNGVDARLGHLDEPLPAALYGAVDVMTAVVPYVPTEAIPFLPRDVLAYEPRTALDGGERGLTLLSAVVARSARWLRAGGWLLLELGGDQAAAVRTEMEAVGFGDLSAIEDDDGDVRMIEGRFIAGQGAVTEA
jgi:release factor glutamine methyltransferase